MDGRSDEQLMAAVMAGDQASLAALVARHHSPLLGYLFRVVGGDRQLAEDLVQDTLVHLLRQRTYSPPRPFKPWLYAIATNLARDHRRSAQVRHHGGWSGDEDHDQLGQLYDGAPGPEECLVGAERGTAVQVAVASLGEEYRTVIVLRFYQEFSLQEISETLQIPLGTVKSRLSVGMHRLRALLAPVREGVE